MKQKSRVSLSSSTKRPLSRFSQHILPKQIYLYSFLCCRFETKQVIMNYRVLTAFLLCLISPSNAFRSTPIRARWGCSSSSLQASTQVDNPMRLTPELLKIANAFESIGDDKLRYKQLLYMANQLTPIDPSQAIPENKVPGCLSTVYIDGKAVDSGNGRIQIEFVGDSDGLLTKGLVALLIRGLSGNTADDIQNVDPAFIQKAGIAASLTPGRNNGFLNMLAVMKKKAKELEGNYQPTESDTTTTTTGDEGPMYQAIVQSLQVLKPVSLKLEDVSYQHAGHAGASASGEESHFNLEIVASAFEGLNLVKRHKLIYMMLGDVMPRIHALQISAKTPEEV